MKLVYWDSCCFVDLLEGTDRSEQLDGVIERVDNKELQLCTSTVTLLEVLGSKKMRQEQRDRIVDFFDRDERNVELVEVSYPIARAARDLFLESGASSEKRKFDFIHLATIKFLASRKRIVEAHSFDRHLLHFDGQFGVPIVEPSLAAYPIQDRIELPEVPELPAAEDSSD